MRQNSSDSNASFLVDLGTALREYQGVDQELAEVLFTYILIEKPIANSIDQARIAIVKLAEKRAKNL